MRSLLVNFSGHPLNEQAKHVLLNTFDRVIESQPVDIAFDSDIGSQLESIIKRLGVKIDGSSSVVIIPPGQSTFAILLVSYLHGLIGHFPNICYLERIGDGLYMPRIEYEVQPQQIRTAGRKFRISGFEK